MEEKSFSYYIWSSITDRFGKIFAFLGVFLTFIGYLVTPEALVSQKILVMGFFAFLTLVFVFIQTAKVIYDDLDQSHSEQKKLKESLESYFDRPEVVYVKTPPSPSKYYSESFAILFTNPTETLPYDSVVSVYFLTDGFEELIAIGKVANIQDDKKVQIILIYDQQFEKYKEKIMGNSKETLSNIIIKPTIPSFMLQGDLYVG